MTATITATATPAAEPSARAAAGLPAGAETWGGDLGGVHLRFGRGVLAELGQEAAALCARRALVVTDEGLVAAGHARRAVEALEAAGIATALFAGTAENPTTEDVSAGLLAARQAGDVDLLVGLGGGSAMDCAKAINFLLTNGGRMEDFWGSGKASRPMLPSIGVPTTAGTGSEAQRFALISQAETHRKMACGDEKARFRTVLLDPELLVSLPRAVAAPAALDAVSHAVESYVTTRRNPLSRLLAAEAWRLLDRHLPAFLADRGDAAAAAAMLWGAHLAGAAIESAMLGAAHATANPLTARYGTTHGLAVAVLLPHVVRYNGDAAGGLYDELAGGPAGEGAARLASRLGELLAAAEVAPRLRDHGVPEADLRRLAAEAAEQWTGRFNPRPVGPAELEEIYRAAW